MLRGEATPLSRSARVSRGTQCSTPGSSQRPALGTRLTDPHTASQRRAQAQRLSTTPRSPSPSSQPSRGSCNSPRRTRTSAAPSSTPVPEAEVQRAQSHWRCHLFGSCWAHREHRRQPRLCPAPGNEADSGSPLRRGMRTRTGSKGRPAGGSTFFHLSTASVLTQRSARRPAPLGPGTPGPSRGCPACCCSTLEAAGRTQAW